MERRTHGPAGNFPPSRRRARIGRGAGSDLLMLAHCLRSWPRSAYAGPLSPEPAQICLRWPIVSGAGSDLLTLAHCLQSWLRSAYAGPLSPELAQICLRWPIVSGAGSDLLTLARTPGTSPLPTASSKLTPNLCRGTIIQLCYATLT